MRTFCLKKELMCEGLFSYLSSISFGWKLPGGVRTLQEFALYLFATDFILQDAMFLQLFGSIFLVHMHLSCIYPRCIPQCQLLPSLYWILRSCAEAMELCRVVSQLCHSCVTVVSQLCTYEVQESFSQINGIQRRRDTECQSAWQLVVSSLRCASKRGTQSLNIMHVTCTTWALWSLWSLWAFCIVR